MKYLIAQRREEPEFIVLCAGHLSHADLAQILRADGFAILSAGFVRFEPDGSATTHGESVSLKLAPRSRDAEIIATFARVTLGGIGVSMPKPAPAPYAPPVFCPGCPAAQS